MTISGSTSTNASSESSSEHEDTRRAARTRVRRRRMARTVAGLEFATRVALTSWKRSAIVALEGFTTGIYAIARTLTFKTAPVGASYSTSSPTAAPSKAAPIGEPGDTTVTSSACSSIEPTR